MQLKPISTLAGVASIAAVALLAIFMVQQTNAPQLSETSQPAASETPATAAPIESQAFQQEAVAVSTSEAPRPARVKYEYTQSAALENGWLPFALNPAPLDYLSLIHI